VIAWYNENQYRDWPFVAGSTVPRDLIVDAGISTNVGQVGDRSSLALIFRVNNTITLNYLVSNIFLRFTVDATTVRDFDVVWSDSVGTTAPTTDQRCLTGSVIAGFIVLGSAATLLRLVPADGANYAPDAALEPAVVDTLVERGVNSISLFNQIRPNSIIAERCSSTIYRRPVDAQFTLADGRTLAPASLNGQCIRGDAQFYAGHSCELSQSDNLKTITISASDSSIEGPACTDVALTQAEIDILANGGVIGGLQRCKDTVRSLNGAIGPHIKIRGENGVKVVTTPGPVVTIYLTSTETGGCDTPAVG
jgi:hypothetical protein